MVEGSDLTFLDNEAGGHRIQRVPPTERKGRVHTSTVTVAVLEPSQVKAVDPSQVFRVEWYSGSGAGGQHRNKHQNSCRITHIPTGTVRKAETRSRANSYQEAMSSLTEALNARYRNDQANAVNNTRRTQVGSGMRGDKRRTYRFQEDRVVDHVTGRSSSCSKLMRGFFTDMWQ